MIFLVLAVRLLIIVLVLPIILASNRIRGRVPVVLSSTGSFSALFLQESTHILIQFLCNNRQYAYVPPTTPQFQSPQLTHEQTAPLRVFQRTNDSQGGSGLLQAQTQVQAHAQGKRAMVPPSLPSSSRFKPPQLRTSTNANTNAQNTSISRNQNQPPLVRHGTRQKMMGPPPTPLLQHAPNVNGPPPSSSRRLISTAQVPNSNRFLPPNGNANVNQNQNFTAGTSFNAARNQNQNQYHPPPTTSTAPQRFAPASGDGGLGSRAPSRASTSNMNISGGGTGQRRPFVPGGFG